jgi:uncharacterized protein YbgA (DUF1722 family)
LRGDKGLIKLINSDTQTFDEIIDALCSITGFTKDELEEKWKQIIEALKYLDLVSYTKEVLTPALIVDYAWHEFILCTKSYAAFCEDKFGKFIHHHPGGRTKQTILQFHRTIKYYILYIGEPKANYWGKEAAIEWEDSQCGSCSPH